MLAQLHVTVIASGCYCSLWNFLSQSWLQCRVLAANSQPLMCPTSFAFCVSSYCPTVGDYYKHLPMSFFFPATRSYVHNNMVYCDLRGQIKVSACSLNYVLYKPCSMDDNEQTISRIQYSGKCFHVQVWWQVHGSLLHQHHLSWASRKHYPMYCANHQSRDWSYRTGWTAPCSCEGFVEKLLIVVQSAWWLVLSIILARLLHKAAHHLHKMSASSHARRSAGTASSDMWALWSLIQARRFLRAQLLLLLVFACMTPFAPSLISSHNTDKKCSWIGFRFFWRLKRSHLLVVSSISQLVAHLFIPT